MCALRALHFEACSKYPIFELSFSAKLISDSVLHHILVKFYLPCSTWLWRINFLKSLANYRTDSLF